ncbi:MAG: serine/threonine-protein kinase [Calothrix sp. MO_167.B42]|nr:serine/threonine-protein kinase [Calothrix sp. MO_167.B42]
MKQDANTTPNNIDTSHTQLIANRYQLNQLIGKGGMGEVFLATDILLGGVSVAIKFLSQTISTPHQKRHFAREARISAVLSQKNLHIVKVTDYGVSQAGRPFYVMEYLSGKNLRDLMPTSLPMFISLARQICLGLQCAHEGISIDGQVYPLVHRDIKPENILVVPNGMLGQLVKILDFGIAKFLNYAGTHTTNQGFNGTVCYSSPEQLDGGELDSRSDIYSLGAIMFEMLANQKPWRVEPESLGAWYRAHQFTAPLRISDLQLEVNIPKQIEDLIMACLAKSPKDRPQNTTEIINILDSVVSENTPAPIQISLVGIDNQDSTSTSTLRCSTTMAAEVGLSVEQACSQLVWPNDKPIQEIVFPKLIETQTKNITTLWIMLSQEEIANHSVSQRYSKFIFLASPHPTLLWLTVFYHPKYGPKWLPSYLDMHNSYNRQLLFSLVVNEQYPVIFFTLEPPHYCAHVVNMFMEPMQLQKLKQWLQESIQMPHSQQLPLSKKLLKQKYKTMQPQILNHLQAIATGVNS